MTQATESVAEAVAPARALRKDAVRNRELLIAAAHEVFARRGSEASLDDVARHAGLGVGTAYRHFANKHELLTAMMADILDGLVLELEQAATIEDPWRALVVFLEAALAVQARDRGLREVMLGVYDPDEMERVHERLSPPLNDIVGRAKAAGVVRADLEPTDIGMFIAMLCAVTEVAGEADPELWRRYLAITLDGIRPGGSPLPVPALDEQVMRTAMATHKHAVARSVTDKPEPGPGKRS
jgi:AcrR family transcriptional regulator